MSQKNIEMALLDISKRFVTLKESDQKQYHNIFKEIFDEVLRNMKVVDETFKQFSSTIQVAGSQYDNLKISKPNEYDMNLVIKLPINYANNEDGILLEKDIPGMLRVKIGRAFDNLRKQQNWESHNLRTDDWRDDKKYLLQSKFRAWMESTVQKALNQMNYKAVVNNISYNGEYRSYNQSWSNGYWYVVPKPSKATNIDEKRRERLWRVSFPDQEREMMKGLQKLKPMIRLMKKLRDNLEMKAIASYYIKTIFLWTIEEKQNNVKYWESSYAILFKDMVQKLLGAINEKKIRFFWNKHANLLDGMRETLFPIYKAKLETVLMYLNTNNCDGVVKSLLTPQELRTYKTDPVPQMRNLCIKDKEDKPVVAREIKDNQKTCSVS